MSKLTTNLSILFGLAILMLTGCEQDTTATLPQPGEEPAEVLFSARIAQVDISTRTSTNYTSKDNFVTNDQIGLFGWKNTITDENQYLGNVKLVSNDGGLSLTADGQKIYFPVQTQTLQLCAYYPFSGTHTTGNHVNIQSELETTSTGISDPLWGQTSVDKPTTSTPATASFNMAHRMGRLKIYVYKDESVLTAYYLKSIKVEFYNQQIGSMNITNGQITAANNTETPYTDDYTTELSTDATALPQYDHTILPAEAISANSAVKSITITIASESEPGSPGNYVIYDATSGSPAIKPTNGGVTRINVKFNPTTLTSANINGWNSEETIINTPHAR